MKLRPPKLRILLTDIETAPIESYHWRLWKENIGIDQIKVDWTILSFSAKWLGEPMKKAVYYDTFDEKDIRNDFPVLEKLWLLLDEADIVVAHNGQAFDLRKIRARMFTAGMNPFSPVRVIDTLTEAKKLFGFSSNKLAWLGDLVGMPKYNHEKFPGFKLWSEFLLRNPAARKEMRKYNLIDIQALEQVYLRLRPWIEVHPNVNVKDLDSMDECPKCGSNHMLKRGTRTTQYGTYQRYQCNDCTGWSYGRQNLVTHHQRKRLLGN
jgi:predicted RNA-binding Zn-ribbon protein involved in translation (DUF1610 family)